jgi:hypothetical protein
MAEQKNYASDAAGGGGVSTFQGNPIAPTGNMTIYQPSFAAAQSSSTGPTISTSAPTSSTAPSSVPDSAVVKLSIREQLKNDIKKAKHQYDDARAKKVAYKSSGKVAKFTQEDLNKLINDKKYRLDSFLHTEKLIDHINTAILEYQETGNRKQMEKYYKILEGPGRGIYRDARFGAEPYKSYLTLLKKILNKLITPIDTSDVEPMLKKQRYNEDEEKFLSDLVKYSASIPAVIFEIIIDKLVAVAGWTPKLVKCCLNAGARFGQITNSVISQASKLIINALSNLRDKLLDNFVLNKKELLAEIQEIESRSMESSSLSNTSISDSVATELSKMQGENINDDQMAQLLNIEDQQRIIANSGFPPEYEELSQSSQSTQSTLSTVSEEKPLLPPPTRKRARSFGGKKSRKQRNSIKQRK